MLTSVLIKAEGIHLSKIVLKVLFDNQRAIHLYKKCFFNEFDRDDKYIYMKRLI
jgi:RimJ/RimL family protein N-acetyltransferase